MHGLKRNEYKITVSKRKINEEKKKKVFMLSAYVYSSGMKRSVCVWKCTYETGNARQEKKVMPEVEKIISKNNYSVPNSRVLKHMIRNMNEKMMMMEKETGLMILKMGEEK